MQIAMNLPNEYWQDHSDYEADELADLKREFSPRKRHTISCSDRMCGADDCLTCHPEGQADERKEEDMGH